MAQGASPSAGGLQRDVIFSEYPEFSSASELARRVFSPLTNLAIQEASANSDLHGQTINLEKEAFTVYVPRKCPPQGFGVLVFIPPWQDARLPAGWATALDESGVIFVTAARSGNGESIIERRIPLALLGAYNVLRRYPVDTERVYVGGFSGGARVAMRVALSYPDVFRGALLNAGSDAIGSKDAVLPPGDLFAQFQSFSRMVYVTGSDDGVNVTQDMGSTASMYAWCVFGYEVETMNRVGHEVATAGAMRRGLATLDQRRPGDPAKLSACRARVNNEMTTELTQVKRLLEAGSARDASQLLAKIDARYTGLASSEILNLVRQVSSQR